MSAYQSILKKEMEDFVSYRKSFGFDCRGMITVLNHLDRLLLEDNPIEKHLTEEQILKLIRSLDVRPYTMGNYLHFLGLFSKHLNSLGIEAYIPEIPKDQSDYTPYIFTEDEWIRIIEMTDNFFISRSPCSSIQMPLLVRLLYGCGLRVHEALSLLVEDVDINKGVLSVIVAKKDKQRFVPMDSSLTFICERYIRILELKDNDYLFPNTSGGRQNINWAWYRFKLILESAGIDFHKGRYERGPCLHCLRHTFVLRAFRQSVENGRAFDESVPFLSTYLGHEGIRETDKYLNFSYELYEGAAEKVSAYTNSLFPEVVL